VCVRRCEGFALVVVLVAMLLLSAFGAALILVSSSESMIASMYRTSMEAFYAAEAMAERAIDDLGAMADWNAALSGVVRSTIVDGPPDGTRRIAGGGTLDLVQAVNFANCGQSACSPADLLDVTGDRLWGPDNPVWQLFGYGPLSAMASPGRIISPFYVIALVARNPAAEIGDPVDTLFVRAEAFGPRNSHKVIELTVARDFAGLHGPDGRNAQDGPDAQRSYPGGGRVRALTWHEIR
jgi:hypothetical protein